MYYATTRLHFTAVIRTTKYDRFFKIKKRLQNPNQLSFKKLLCYVIPNYATTDNEVTVK